MPSPIPRCAGSWIQAPRRPLSGQNETCEYAVGADGPAGLTELTKQAKSATPAHEPISVDIGGSADCGVAGPGGAVASIVVPERFYNVHASFAFFNS